MTRKALTGTTRIADTMLRDARGRDEDTMSRTTPSGRSSRAERCFWQHCEKHVEEKEVEKEKDEMIFKGKKAMTISTGARSVRTGGSGRTGRT